MRACFAKDRQIVTTSIALLIVKLQVSKWLESRLVIFSGLYNNILPTVRTALGLNTRSNALRLHCGLCKEGLPLRRA